MVTIIFRKLSDLLLLPLRNKLAAGVGSLLIVADYNIIFLFLMWIKLSTQLLVLFLVLVNTFAANRH